MANRCVCVPSLFTVIKGKSQRRSNWTSHFRLEGIFPWLNHLSHRSTDDAFIYFQCRKFRQEASHPVSRAWIQTARVMWLSLTFRACQHLQPDTSRPSLAPFSMCSPIVLIREQRCSSSFCCSAPTDSVFCCYNTNRRNHTNKLWNGEICFN